MNISNYKELIVWQKSMELVHEIYKILKLLPKSELFGLVSQIQRAVVAIASNIAEGYARNHRAEFIQFLGIAHGSSTELETQLIIISQEYRSINLATAMSLLEEVQKMLAAMIRNLKPSNL